MTTENHFLQAISPRPADLPDALAPQQAAHSISDILASTLTASLATLDPCGWPYVSLINLCSAPPLTPLFLLSDLALHSRNLRADPRISLLLCASGKGDALAHPRLTLSGTAHPDPDPALRDTFLTAHPKSRLYADFPDFTLYRLDVDALHFNGGFARSLILSSSQFLAASKG